MFEVRLDSTGLEYDIVAEDLKVTRIIIEMRLSKVWWWERKGDESEREKERDREEGRRRR